MSMDPHKWVEFEELTGFAQERIGVLYPYLKVDQCTFQEKDSGVFMKQANSVKVEKLLDPLPLEEKRVVATQAVRSRR